MLGCIPLVFAVCMGNVECVYSLMLQLLVVVELSA